MDTSRVDGVKAPLHNGTPRSHEIFVREGVYPIINKRAGLQRPQPGLPVFDPLLGEGHVHQIAVALPQQIEVELMRREVREVVPRFGRGGRTEALVVFYREFRRVAPNGVLPGLVLGDLRCTYVSRCHSTDAASIR